MGKTNWNSTGPFGAYYAYKSPVQYRSFGNDTKGRF